MKLPPKTPSLSLLSLLAVAGIGSAQTSGTTLQPSFQGLGDLPGGSVESYAAGISPDGSAVVGYSKSTNGTEAFLWTAAGGMVGLGDLSGSGFYSQATAVSSYGTVVVGTGTGPNGYQAFQWTPTGGMQPIGNLPGALTSHAMDVSGSGEQIVGYYEDALGLDGFVTDAFLGTFSLRDTFGGLGTMGALGISSFGNKVVGYSASAVHQAVAWDLWDGSTSALAPSSGLSPYSAGAASADGSVIVGIAKDPSGPISLVAMRWEGTTASLESAQSYTLEATAVSGTGERVVGTGFSPAGGSFVWIWDATNGVRALETALQDDYGLSLGNWDLERCVDISGDGQRIAGYGINPDGEQEAFLAVLPIAHRADLNKDGLYDLRDVTAFGAAYAAKTAVGDFNGDGAVTIADVADFSVAYNSQQ